MLFLLAAWAVHFSQAQDPAASAPPAIADICFDQLKIYAQPKEDLTDLRSACQKVKVLEGCQSVKGQPIFYYEKQGTNKNPKRIFAKSLIHGDEYISGAVAKAWVERLEKIEPRNTWRVIPVANPDGFAAKTRTNAHGIDLNRNFPTKDWTNQAVHYWKTKAKSDPRRNPGVEAASEPETKCLIKHFDEFDPDFLISVHTPLGVLDLDGPKVTPPRFRPLPWTSLGSFPGSLGRYMWIDRKVPVLTIELKGNEDLKKLEAFDRLQDISGTIAIQAGQLRKKTKE